MKCLRAAWPSCSFTLFCINPYNVKWSVNTFCFIKIEHTLPGWSSLIGWKCLTLAVSVSWPSLSVAGLTHPDGPTAPTSFWHRHPVAGAGMAETLATWPAVVLPLCLLEHLLTAMTGLRSTGRRRIGWWEERHGNIIMAGNEWIICSTMSNFCVLPCYFHVWPCVFIATFFYD